MWKSLSYQCKCCWGPFACGLCCRPAIVESVSSRTLYILGLFIVAALACISGEERLFFVLQEYLSNHMNTTCVKIGAEVNCTRLFGFMAVYRLGFTLVVYHLTLCILTLWVMDSRGWRASIHNGFWMIKFFVLSGIWLMFYLLPVIEEQADVLMYVAICGGAVFLIIQQIVLIDLSYDINATLQARAQHRCCWNVLLYAITVLLCLGGIGAFVLLFVWCALPAGCIINKLYISINCFFSLVLAAIAWAVGAERRHSRHRIVFPGAAAIAYTLFLTWTAVMSEPALELVMPSAKHWNASHNDDLGAVQWSAIFSAAVPFLYPNTTAPGHRYVRELYCRPRSFIDEHIMAYISFLIMLSCVLYAALSTSRESERLGISRSRVDLRASNLSLQNFDAADSPPPSVNPPPERRRHFSGAGPVASAVATRAAVATSSPTRPQVSHLVISPSQAIGAAASGRPNRQRNISRISTSQMSLSSVAKAAADDPDSMFVTRDEIDERKYSYSLFHFICALAAFYVTVQLTEWYNPSRKVHMNRFGQTWVSVWVKVVSSWVFLLLFGYTLICPGFCPGRDIHAMHWATMRENQKRRQERKARRATATTLHELHPLAEERGTAAHRAV